MYGRIYGYPRSAAIPVSASIPVNLSAHLCLHVCLCVAVYVCILYHAVSDYTRLRQDSRNYIMMQRIVFYCLELHYIAHGYACISVYTYICAEHTLDMFIHI